MKKDRYNIFVIFLFFLIPLNGQEQILASSTRGCDSIEVSFELTNALPAESYTSIEWRFGDGTLARGALDATHIYPPGVYSVRCLINNQRVIEFADTIVVSVTPSSEFVFQKSDQSVADSYIYDFKSTYNQPLQGIEVAYIWQFEELGYSNENVQSLHDTIISGNPLLYEILYDEEADSLGVYLSVTDDIGCSSSDTSVIYILKNHEPDKYEEKDALSFELNVPNVFSPNSDGENDYFEVMTYGDLLYTFKVFSASGILVYSSYSTSIVWNGRTIDGSFVQEGIYYYLIEDELSRSKRGYIYVFK